MGIEASIILYSAIAGLSTIVGIILVFFYETLVIRYSHYVNSFAAGLILGIAFFHLIPESLHLADDAMDYVFFGFLIFYLLESFIVIHSGAEIHYREKINPLHQKGIIMFSGLFFHSLIDGIIIAVGFGTSQKLGLLTSLGVIAHELPEGATSFSLMINSMQRRTALLLSAAVALATPVGAIGSLIFARGLSEVTIGILIAMAAGSFLYIGASDLIPETHEENGLINACFLISGVTILYVLSKMLMI
ncbi:putative Zinc transporter ZupT [uncultured Desulfobacterium sp.]|uniref:Putative Zinc transporter ZupT n=1 Tax=uncultured Desulfobacterium sp. TaxID=201089 RepID=A0A445MZ05_9BACT|nr:putative Zinc transporter ZupT [uncultured Desulfobacterium sp.]